MLLLIENGEIYAPEPLGQNSILIAHERILKIGEIDRKKIESLGVELEVINARNRLVTPGLIDPHQHLLGGSGEAGFATQTPEISASEIIEAGITTVVGCLGVDTTMKTLPGLLAKVKGMKEEGLNAFMWSGGYNVPTTTITSDARDDIMFIEEVIGAGEIAISDERTTEPDFHELAHLVHDAYVGGMLSRKCGRTHFHVGTGPRRMRLLFELIEKDDISPEWIYPTHINRSDALMLEAVELAGRGAFVDIDTVDEDLPRWLEFYRDHGGDPKRLTLSSDASITSPQNLLGQFRECVLKHGFEFAEILPLVTKNTAAALKLGNTGAIKEGAQGDVLVLDKKTLRLGEVVCRGKPLLRDGKLAFKEAFLKQSNRRIKLTGAKR